MRKLYVPIKVDPQLDRTQFLQDFKALGADHIFLVPHGRVILEKEEIYRERLAQIAEHTAFYKEQGYESGVWISTIGYGGPLGETAVPEISGYTQIRSIVGKDGGDALCPLDENFTARVLRTLKDIVRCGARMIMLDDELCLSVRPGIGCACDRHLKEFSKRMGEEITLEGLPERIFTGKSNPYRRTWMEMQGDTLRNFCRAMREAVDSVDPTVRMGFCAGYTSWDVEGVDALELTYILAGNTKPFLRYTSAPYWYQAQRFGQTPMPTFIEFVRMQAAWCRDSGVELFSECDTYPHDRYHTPRAHIECFDVGTMLTPDVGVLKYFYHYPCQPQAERGYIDADLRARPVTSAMQQAFHSRPECGVRVYEAMHKLADATLPAKFDAVKSQKWIMKKYAFPEAQMMLSVNAIPTVYEGTGLCGIVFGENARYLPSTAFEKGLILDVSAAEILQEKGIDVGLRSCRALPAGILEDFGDGMPPVSVYWATDLCDVEPDAAAQTLSRFVTVDSAKEKRAFPAAYLYENANGQRFLVYAFRSQNQPETSGMYWSYGRGKQIADAITWLAGRALPAVCVGNPHLYCRCNEDGSSVVAAYFNCTADGIDSTEVHFARDVASVNILGGKGYQKDARTVVLEDVRSFGYVAIEADYK